MSSLTYVRAGVALLALAASGCATIVAKSTQSVTVTSVPPSAAVTITNRAGTLVHSGTTPLTVSLKKGAGYFKPESYTLRFTREGFEPRELKLTGTVSGWYFGNIVFGGLIGMLAVDPSTGAMYKLQPDTVEATMQALKVTQTADAGALLVVSTRDVPANVLEQAELISAN